MSYSKGVLAPRFVLGGHAKVGACKSILQKFGNEKINSQIDRIIENCDQNVDRVSKSDEKLHICIM